MPQISPSGWRLNKSPLLADFCGFSPKERSLMGVKSSVTGSQRQSWMKFRQFQKFRKTTSLFVSCCLLANQQKSSLKGCSCHATPMLNPKQRKLAFMTKVCTHILVFSLILMFSHAHQSHNSKSWVLVFFISLLLNYW